MLLQMQMGHHLIVVQMLTIHLTICLILTELEVYLPLFFFLLDPQVDWVPLFIKFLYVRKRGWGREKYPTMYNVEFFITSCRAF